MVSYRNHATDTIQTLPLSREGISVSMPHRLCNEGPEELSSAAYNNNSHIKEKLLITSKTGFQIGNLYRKNNLFWFSRPLKLLHPVHKEICGLLNTSFEIKMKHKGSLNSITCSYSSLYKRLLKSLSEISLYSHSHGFNLLSEPIHRSILGPSLRVSYATRQKKSDSWAVSREINFVLQFDPSGLGNRG